MIMALLVLKREELHQFVDIFFLVEESEDDLLTLRHLLFCPVQFRLLLTRGVHQLLLWPDIEPKVGLVHKPGLVIGLLVQGPIGRAVLQPCVVGSLARLDKEVANKLDRPTLTLLTINKVTIRNTVTIRMNCGSERLDFRDLNLRMRPLGLLENTVYHMQ